MKIFSHSRSLIVVLLSVGLLYNRVEATTSLGFDISGGKNLHGSDINGSYDIKPSDTQMPWTVSAGFSYFHSTLQTESKTNTFNLGLDHALDNSNDFRGSVTFSKDSVNEIKYAGPSLGYTYTWLDNGSANGTSSGKNASTTYKLLSEEDTSGPGSVNTATAGNEVAALSFDMDIFVYSFDVTTASQTVRVGRRTSVIAARTASDTITQVHPNVQFEKPFLDNRVIPSIEYGHYFYSKDPAGFANVAGAPRFATVAGRLNTLAGGFLNNNLDAAVSFPLVLNIYAQPRIGVEQSAIDNSWATIQEVTMTRMFWDHVQAKLDWTRTIQFAISADLFTGGLTYYFN